MKQVDTANIEQQGVVSIWVGSFPSAEAFEDYLREQYEADGAPISRFAGETGLDWYDHDLLEAQRYEAPLAVSAAVGPLSFSASYINAASQAAQQLGMGPINTVVLLIDCAYASDQAVPTDRSPLKFLGAFPYDESSAPAEGGDAPLYAR